MTANKCLQTWTSWVSSEPYTTSSRTSLFLKTFCPGVPQSPLLSVISCGSSSHWGAVVVSLGWFNDSHGAQQLSFMLVQTIRKGTRMSAVRLMLSNQIRVFFFDTEKVFTPLDCFILHLTLLFCILEAQHTPRHNITNIGTPPKPVKSNGAKLQLINPSLNKIWHQYLSKDISKQCKDSFIFLILSFCYAFTHMILTALL